MNIPQEEDKRYQSKPKTEQVLPYNSALNSSPPFSNIQNGSSNSLQASSTIDAQRQIEENSRTLSQRKAKRIGLEDPLSRA